MSSLTKCEDLHPWLIQRNQVIPFACIYPTYMEDEGFITEILVFLHCAGKQVYYFTKC